MACAWPSPIMNDTKTKTKTETETENSIIIHLIQYNELLLILEAKQPFIHVPSYDFVNYN